MSDDRDGIVGEGLADLDDAHVRALLVDLELEQQGSYDHPRQSRVQIDRGLPSLRADFVGENHLFVARDAQAGVVGVCWCVLFDPGTGLESEVAELYVATYHPG